MRTRLTTLALLTLLATLAAAQARVGIGADLGALARGGAWSSTYGNTAAVGARVELIRANKWIAAAQADLLFGSDVRVDPLAGLRDAAGQILGDIGPNGQVADVQLRSRARRGGLLVGYRRGLSGGNSGVRALAGPTYSVHYIRIQDDPLLTTSNLRAAYKRGYDRRAGGWGAGGELGLDYTLGGGDFAAYLVLRGDLTASRALNSTQFDLGGPQVINGVDTSLGLQLGVVLGLGQLGGGGEDDADDIYY